MSISRNNNFDFIRFAAAATVWFVHCGIFYNLPLYDLFQLLSRSAVYVFFIVSGYFVTKSFEHSNGALTYFRNRALRILPAMFVVVLISVFLMGPVATSLDLHSYFSSHATWHYLKSLMVFPIQYTLPGVFTDNHVANTSVNGPLWSLRYEVSCYIAVAVLGWAGLLRWSVMLALFVLAWFIRIYDSLAYLYVVPETFITALYHMDTWKKAVDFCPGFAAGALMYLARTKIPLKQSYCLIAVMLASVSFYMWGECMLFHVALTYAVISIGFSKIPLHHFGKYGDFSYGMYIYAWPIQELFLHFFKHASFLTFLAASSSVAMTCAVLSWYFVEKPALRHKA